MSQVFHICNITRVLYLHPSVTKHHGVQVYRMWVCHFMYIMYSFIIYALIHGCRLVRKNKNNINSDFNAHVTAIYWENNMTCQQTIWRCVCKCSVWVTISVFFYGVVPFISHPHPHAASHTLAHSFLPSLLPTPTHTLP